ncbi:DUF559 domain-containing protein [Rhodococcus ruber]|uniref:endonuclease domain-containing protein n=1 Tax=Rhodococcus TaxID=1827 RepID=UPI000C79CD07|nr:MULTISPECIES: DUF559 domain-containing protein [Rhodococcus]RIK11046.1 MAG: DUF559 domain-containing protein [Acidobacteriota bacterium]AUM17994.1 hypothetical protein CSW53_16560 [Rhodococcus ruber]MBD8053042.1 DUF559 domain-containing protein [Rhodococcus ruber]MCF8781491.1 DUF559 domain-containing protein [Rhodococcus ruber]QRE82452.1 DUF559 domain-containing protein [Rhodococcus ruber]
MHSFDAPFRGTEAIASGALTAYELRHGFVRLHRDVYVRRGVAPTARNRARAAWLWSAGRGTLAGLSAAALHGTKWIDGSAPAELLRAGHVRAPSGIVVRQGIPDDDELCRVDGMTVTSPARTGFDLGRTAKGDRAVELLDALCHATGVKPAEIRELACRHAGARGVSALRQVLEFVDGGAESPPETRTRLLLVRGGLPVPETQIHVRAADGRLLARADLGWRSWRVLVEYDGGHHWTDPAQRTRDIDRYALLESAGWRVVRVDARLLAERPDVVLERVRAALRAAGARW